MTILGMNIVPEPLLRQKVTEAIRASIAAGNLAPGQKLVEREICGELGISRTVLREALQHLEAEGLIVNRSRRGRSVASIGREEARQIYEVRRALEGLIGAGFAENATALQIGRLKTHLQSIRNRPPRDIFAAEQQFFAMMLEHCGNQVAADFARQLDGRIMILKQRSAFQNIPLAERLSELGAIAAAVEARNGRLAGDLCMKRIERLSESVDLLTLPEAVAS
ncbi:GntR family transcriptional regulator [Rhizobium puerariae]|uniref:GntR family transcriptional regulator n=1 Tax=Rhizobium puerariae TaxID=1585791 RepID=A0ABV6ANS3_9HYPH